MPTVSSASTDPVVRHPIFLIEGDHAVRDAVTSSLRAAGFTVLAFVTAEEFLEHAGAGPGCLLVDLDLPGMSGLDLLDRLQSRRPPLPAVLMSGRLRSAIARTHPAVDVLHKPFGADELTAMIRASLESACRDS